MIVLGAAGQYESGKDTLADLLVQKYGFQKYAFADNVKGMCMKIFELTHDQCYTTEGKERPLASSIVFDEGHINGIMVWAEERSHWKTTAYHRTHLLDIVKKKAQSFLNTPRELLQFVGAEICRDVFSPNFHVEVIAQKIKCDKPDRVIISDARFRNERRFIKDKYAGRNIYIHNPELMDNGDSHSSESELGSIEDYDFVFINDKRLGLKICERQVDIMCKWLEIAY